MLKRVNNTLNIVIGSIVGTFLGKACFVYWDYRKYPNLYAMQSAPWYTSIVVAGLFTAIVLVIAIISKYFVRKKLKNI